MKSREEYHAQIKELISQMRSLSKNKEILDEELIIPDDCEKYGFVEGKHNLGTVLHFLADMME